MVGRERTRGLPRARATAAFDFDHPAKGVPPAPGSTSAPCARRSPMTRIRGPGLHKHPYSEICIVCSGRVAIIVGGEEKIAGSGDIVVIGPETSHRFTAIGDERLDMVC